MNPLLARLQPYPFDRLRTLLSGITPRYTATDRLNLTYDKCPKGHFKCMMEIGVSEIVQKTNGLL